MINGIYHVTVSTSDGQHSDGQWVIDNHSLQGTDATSRYQGQFHLSGQHVAMQMNVSRHQEAERTLFGPAMQYLLSLNGHFMSDSNAFNLSGPVAQVPALFATISGHWLKALD